MRWRRTEIVRCWTDLQDALKAPDRVRRRTLLRRLRKLRLIYLLLAEKMYHAEYAADYEREMRRVRICRGAEREARRDAAYWKRRTRTAERMLGYVLADVTDSDENRTAAR